MMNLEIIIPHYIYESGPIATRFRLFSPGSKRTQNFPFRKQHLEFRCISTRILSFIPTHKKRSDYSIIFKKRDWVVHIGMIVREIKANGYKTSYLT